MNKVFTVKFLVIIVTVFWVVAIVTVWSSKEDFKIVSKGEPAHIDRCGPCAERVPVVLCDGEWSNPIFVRSKFEDLFVMLPHSKGDRILDDTMSPWGFCANWVGSPLTRWKMKWKYQCLIEAKDLTVLGRSVYDQLEGFEAFNLTSTAEARAKWRSKFGE